MRSHIRSNVVGYVALFVALATPAWAAPMLDRNSVGTEQIRNRDVRGIDVGRNQIRSPHLGRGAIRSTDIGRLRYLNLTENGRLVFGPRGVTISTLTGGLSTSGLFRVRGALVSRAVAIPVEDEDFFGGAELISRRNSEGVIELVALFPGGQRVLATQPSP